MNITLEEINQPEEPTQDQPPISFDSVQRKRQNKIFKCENCGKNNDKENFIICT